MKPQDAIRGYVSAVYGKARKIAEIGIVNMLQNGSIPANVDEIVVKNISLSAIEYCFIRSVLQPAIASFSQVRPDWRALHARYSPWARPDSHRDEGAGFGSSRLGSPHFGRSLGACRECRLLPSRSVARNVAWSPRSSNRPSRCRKKGAGAICRSALRIVRFERRSDGRARDRA